MFRCKKSQIVIIDLVIALFIATILIIVIILAWNRYTIILNEDCMYKEMQIIAFQTADLLIKTGGEPIDWEKTPSSVDVIGLASSDRSLSIEKVAAFLNLSYNISSKSLGLEFYDFYFQLKHVNGTKLGEYGKPPNNFVVNAQRLVSYKNEKAIVEFAVWK